ncbi:hypothetical protein JCM11491_002189 [Sporobolomyces phaffii]
MNNLMIPLSEQSDEDLAFMDAAVAMAEEAFSASEIPVGCVLVHDGRIIAKGRNRTNEGRNATLHAEFDALRHLLPDRSHPTTLPNNHVFTPQDGSDHVDDTKPRKIWQTPLKGVVLYVTVEPCIMCAAAMRQIGIEKVIYGCGNDRFGGTGGVQSIHSDTRLVYSPPYPAVGNYRREEAIMLLRRFYLTENTAAPKPKNKKNRVLKEEIEQVATPTSPLSSSTPAPSSPSSTTPETSAAMAT